MVFFYGEWRNFLNSPFLEKSRLGERSDLIFYSLDMTEAGKCTNKKITINEPLPAQMGC